MSRDQAAEVVGAVAERLLSPEMVAEIAGRGTDRTADGVVGPAWQPAGLAEGHPGIALLHAELGNPVVAHAHLAAANHAADPTGGGPELYAGRLPGLLLAAVGARRAEGGGYTTLTDQLVPAVELAVRRTADDACPADVSTFDTINGLSGASRLLLAAGADATDGLNALVEVASTPAEHLDLGLSHGVAGPLAVLSIAYRNGVRVDRQTETIERLVDWLIDHQDGNGAWPEQLAPDGSVRVPAGRPTWCYGVPGIARALYLAGDALDVPRWKSTAVEAVVQLRPRGAYDAELCHGWAGLLHVTQRMMWDTGDERLTAAADGLARHVIDLFDPATPFGYRYGTAGLYPDRPGFLWGAAGVALALHAYVAGRPATGWDQALLVD